MSRRIVGMAVAMMFTLAMILPTVLAACGLVDVVEWMNLTILAVGGTVLIISLAPMVLEADGHA